MIETLTTAGIKFDILGTHFRHQVGELYLLFQLSHILIVHFKGHLQLLSGTYTFFEINSLPRC